MWEQTCHRTSTKLSVRTISTATTSPGLIGLVDSDASLWQEAGRLVPRFFFLPLRHALPSQRISSCYSNKTRMICLKYLQSNKTYNYCERYCFFTHMYMIIITQAMSWRIYFSSNRNSLINYMFVKLSQSKHCAVPFYNWALRIPCCVWYTIQSAHRHIALLCVAPSPPYPPNHRPPPHHHHQRRHQRQSHCQRRIVYHRQQVKQERCPSSGL